MSYGQNRPWGLQAVKTLNGATWNGQDNPYLIYSGYPNNIFRGDPVVIGGTQGGSFPDAAGYIISLYDYNMGAIAAVGNTNFQQGASLGVFNGCEYINTSGINPIDPASPGRSYWPAGTLTFGGVPATAFVTDDPSVIFNVQTNSAPGFVGGITQNMVGMTAAVAFTFVGATGVVAGDTIKGTSKVSLNQNVMGIGGAANTNYNLKILRIVPYVNNTSGVVYNNVEVVIQNHFLCSRPTAAV